MAQMYSDSWHMIDIFLYQGENDGKYKIVHSTIGR